MTSFATIVKLSPYWTGFGAIETIEMYVGSISIETFKLLFCEVI